AERSSVPLTRGRRHTVRRDSGRSWWRLGTGPALLGRVFDRGETGRVTGSRGAGGRGRGCGRGAAALPARTTPKSRGPPPPKCPADRRVGRTQAFRSG